MSSSTKRVVLVITLFAALILVGQLSNRSPRQTSCSCGSTCSIPPPGMGKELPRLEEIGNTTDKACRMMSPILDEISSEYKDRLAVEFIDISNNSRAAERYNVRKVPTQIFRDESGCEFARHEGFLAKKDILARFKEHGIDLKKEN